MNEMPLEAPTLSQYCILATIGFSDRKVKSRLFITKGIGMMRLMKSAISNTNNAKTLPPSPCQSSKTRFISSALLTKL